MKPIYDLLGVTVGIIQSGMHDIDKQEAYSRDVVYGTNSEFGFDYLRDNLADTIERKAQRGHGYAIVDEVDNILIDEARTPLIISGQPEQAADLYYKFAKLARIMEPGKKPEGLEAKSKDWEADFDFEPEEKHKTVAVSEKGVEKAEKFLGIDNLYNAENGHLVNHLQQALKAESLYKRDVDYAVIDGQVKIIDEFTGRILEGRRWSEGLHQAVEAKEGVAIQEENQTVATITYQNYFRKYDKLAGMTGTALTEATEFMKIYELQVVEVPTNRPMVRRGQQRPDLQDQGRQVGGGRARDRGAPQDRPAGAGRARSRSRSRSCCRAELTKRGIKHTVLNAKPEHAEREGEIIAEAGAPGRGHDRHQHGRPRRGHQARRQRGAPHPARADQARPRARHRRVGQGLGRAVPARWRPRSPRTASASMEAGGLFILGTERHESRRIDNQLRGRSGRQGDPGESRFYLSAEDDLVRLFAGDRIYRILDNKFLAQEDDEGNEMPIEHKMLTKQIEGAQKKVEDQNFLQRKRVLEYDDVMNQQREIIYEYRDRILEGAGHVGRRAHADRRRDRAARAASTCRATTRRTGTSSALFTQLEQIYPTSYDVDDIAEGEGREALVEKLRADVVDAYNEREQELGDELMRALERFMLLQIIDNRWREHLHDMDYLREGIHLRGFAQIDPLVAYKNEGFEMFTELMNNIWDEFARYIFNVEVAVEPEQPQRAAAAGRWGGGSTSRHRRLNYAGGHSAQGREAIAAAAGRRAAGGVAEADELADERADQTRCRWSRRAASTRTRRSAATTRAGAAPARSSRSAMAPSAWQPSATLASATS